jgi:hypothetical protein
VEILDPCFDFGVRERILLETCFGKFVSMVPEIFGARGKFPPPQFNITEFLTAANKYRILETVGIPPPNPSRHGSAHLSTFVKFRFFLERGEASNIPTQAPIDRTSHSGHGLDPAIENTTPYR